MRAQHINQKQRRLCLGAIAVLFVVILAAFTIPWIASSANAENAKANLDDASMDVATTVGQENQGDNQIIKKGNDLKLIDGGIVDDVNAVEYEYDGDTMTIKGSGALIRDYVANGLKEHPEIEKIIISEGFTSIEAQTFTRMNAITNIVIPSTVTSIGNAAFQDCTKLKNIIIPSGVTSINEKVFFGCNKLESVSIPDTVTVINKQAFSFCTLEDITIPASVTTISDEAFSRAPIKSIRFDGTVGSSGDGIGNKAFNYVGTKGSEETTKLYLPPTGILGPASTSEQWHGGYFNWVKEKITPTVDDFVFNSETGIVSAAEGKSLGDITNYYQVNGAWTPAKPTEEGTYSVGVVTTGSDVYEAVGSVESPFTSGDWLYEVKPATVTVEGTKTWVDNDDKAGLRPSSITVNLLADGKQIDSKEVQADSDGNWKYSFTNLPKYSEDGEEIIYSIDEDAVEYYVKSITGYNITNTLNAVPTYVKIDCIDSVSKESLAGAGIDLSFDGTSIYSWTSTGEPLEIILYSPGDYAITNTVAPKGYEVAESIIFTLTADGKITIGGEEVVDNLINVAFTKTITPIDVPKAVENLKYNGEEQTGVPAGTGYTIIDNVKVDAGTYNAIATLEKGYCWKDKSTDPVTIQWSIAKADSAFGDIPAVVNVDSGSSYDFTYTFNGDGVVSMTTSKDDVANVAFDSATKKATISGISEGDAEIAVSAVEGKNYKAPAAVKIAVVVGLPVAKTKAKTAIDNAIDENSSMLEKTKAANAKALIDSASTVSDVNKAKENGLKAIANAKQTVNTAIKSINDKAGSNPAVVVDKAAKSAIDNIMQAAIESDVEAAKTEGLEAVTFAKTVVDNAIQAINKAAGINPSDAVKEAAQNAIDAINKAETLTDVDMAKDAGVSAIEEIQLDEAKTEAKSVIEKAAEGSLSKLVINEVTNATAAIDAATTIEEVTAAKTAGLPKVTQAKQAVDNAIKAINDAMGENPSEAVRQAAQKAIDAINNAETLEDVEKAQEAGLKSIEDTKAEEAKKAAEKDEANTSGSAQTGDMTYVVVGSLMLCALGAGVLAIRKRREF